MGQNAPSYKINFGGDGLHKHAILEAHIQLDKDGFSFENSEWLGKKSLYPGVPDVYCSKTEKGVKRFWIVEIETHATKESIEKKRKQFFESILNTELIIIDLTKMQNENDLKELRELIKSRLP